MSLIHTLIIWLVAYLPMTISNGQSTPKSITGEYYLSGVREVGSGIKLNPDSTFEFFFTYGALDRFGSGSWKSQGNQIVLTSRPRPEKDFALVTSRTIPGNKLTIRIIDPNTQLLRYVAVSIRSGTAVLREMTDTEGKANFAKQPIESISLRFELCPDRYFIFAVTNRSHNYFEFRLEPWIPEVFFENVGYTRFQLMDLTGRTPYWSRVKSTRLSGMTKDSVFCLTLCYVYHPLQLTAVIFIP